MPTYRELLQGVRILLVVCCVKIVMYYVVGLIVTEVSGEEEPDFWLKFYIRSTSMCVLFLVIELFL